LKINLASSILDLSSMLVDWDWCVACGGWSNDSVWLLIHIVLTVSDMSK